MSEIVNKVDEKVVETETPAIVETPVEVPAVTSSETVTPVVSNPTPIASVTPISSGSDSAVERDVNVNVIIDTKEETDPTDVTLMTTMLKQMGTETETKVPVAKEELQLLQPFESHVSELMFTDPVFKMYVCIFVYCILCNRVIYIYILFCIDHF